MFTKPVSQSLVGSLSVPQVEEVAGPWPVDPTYGVGEAGPEIKPFTLPQLEPLSSELSLG